MSSRYLRTFLTAVLLLVTTVLAVAVSSAHADTSIERTRPTSVKTVVDSNKIRVPADLTGVPLGFKQTGKKVRATANKVSKIKQLRKDTPDAQIKVFLKGSDRWQVSYYGKDGIKEIGQVEIYDSTGRVKEAWTGFQVGWSMARGYPGAFGRVSNSLNIWLTLSVLFILPFLNPKNVLSMRNLDLLMLLSFSVSLAFFNSADIATSVLLPYPPLIYLLLRLLWIGFKRRPDSAEIPKLLFSPKILFVMALGLAAFRIWLNFHDSNVIDVGYASVIGADRIVDGKQLYNNFPSNNVHGDTYGPFAYYSYIPFEQIWSWSGQWDTLPAAHAAAISFDLLTVVMLFIVGRKIGGWQLGTVFSYAWLAFPFTLFTLSSNTNDAVVSFTLLVVVLALNRPLLRGGALALAGLSKLAPLALLPLAALKRVNKSSNVAQLLKFAVGFAVVATLLFIPFIDGGELKQFYERAVKNQLQREAPFSAWGYYELSGGLRTLIQVSAGLAVLAAAGALWRWRSKLPKLGLLALTAVVIVPALAVVLHPFGLKLAVQLMVLLLISVVALYIWIEGKEIGTVRFAALAGAVMIALQLTVNYWFYTYIVWFLPLALIAILSSHTGGLERSERTSVSS